MGFLGAAGAGMTAHLGKAELLRMRRQGVLPLSLELGLELLDAVLSRAEAVLIPLHLDVGVMQRQLGGAEVPALYRMLLRGGLQRASAGRGETSALRARLAALASDAERLQALVQLVQEDIAAVLAAIRRAFFFYALLLGFSVLLVRTSASSFCCWPARRRSS